MSNDNVFERLFKLWAMVAKLVLDGKRDPQRVADILQGIVNEVSGSIVAISKMVVNYSCSIAELVKAGKFDWVNDDINDQNFSSTEIGERELDTAMFYFGRNMSSQAVGAEMDKVGYRPATMKELLAYGIKNPDEQRKYPIVALGSVAELRGHRRVGCLCSDGSKRGADLDDYVCGWLADCRFLAVRKDSVT